MGVHCLTVWAEYSSGSHPELRGQFYVKASPQYRRECLRRFRHAFRGLIRAEREEEDEAAEARLQDEVYDEDDMSDDDEQTTWRVTISNAIVDSHVSIEWKATGSLLEILRALKRFAQTPPSAGMQKCYKLGCPFTAVYCNASGESMQCWRCGHDVVNVFGYTEVDHADAIITDENQRDPKYTL